MNDEKATNFVYVLRHANTDRIKIGVSATPFARSRLLPEIIDYEGSMQVEVDPRWARRIEKTLHYVARDFALEPYHKGDGATEWFRADALPVVSAFVERNPEMFAGRGFVALERPQATPKTQVASQPAQKRAATSSASMEKRKPGRPRIPENERLIIHGIPLRPAALEDLRTVCKALETTQTAFIEGAIKRAMARIKRSE